MSGGAFNYQDMRLDDIADVIDDAIISDDHINVDDILVVASRATRKLGKFLHAVDYYLEGDTGEEDLVEAFEEFSK